MSVRIAGLACALLLLSGCDVARVVDCGTRGRFVRADDDAWCVYESRSAACPMLLPEEHRLDWGGLGCAEEPHEVLPDDPCLQTGACEAGDAG